MRLRTLLLAGTLLAAACGRTGFDLTGGDDGNGTPTPSGSPTGSATPPVLDYGDGLDGDLTVSASDQTVNVCEAVVSASGTTITMSDTAGFVTGRKLVIIQVQDAFTTTGVDNASGDPGGAGAWEIAVISTTSSTTITTAAPLSREFDSSGDRRAQACTLPQFRNVQVPSSTSLAAPPWDGSEGGFLAFLVSETLTLDGSLTASGAGFRGGVRGGTFSNTGITGLDTTMDEGGGKGEGIDRRSFSRWGRGSYRNAAGGGNSLKAGGAGGAGGGDGGAGGLEEANGANTGGQAGTAVAGTSLLFVFGGGGAAGDQDALNGAGLGGAGGGVILVAADRLSGPGAIIAHGANGGNSVMSDGGGGGGGGGGTIVLTVDMATYTGAIAAGGGSGGNTQDNSGPGGGGGGGRVHAPSGLTTAVPGGEPGADNTGNAGGATGGSAGAVL